jgi:hypothetical protein
MQSNRIGFNAAREKSTDIEQTTIFHIQIHTGFTIRSHESSWITYRAVAENIAMGQKTAKEVVKGWMNSPGHCAKTLLMKISLILESDTMHNVDLYRFFSCAFVG